MFQERKLLRYHTRAAGSSSCPVRGNENLYLYIQAATNGRRESAQKELNPELYSLPVVFNLEGRHFLLMLIHNFEV